MLVFFAFTNSAARLRLQASSDHGQAEACAQPPPSTHPAVTVVTAVALKPPASVTARVALHTVSPAKLAMMSAAGLLPMARCTCDPL